MSRLFSPFPKIKTERLLLRKLRSGDVMDIFALRSNTRVSQHIDRPLDKLPEDSQEFISFINSGIKEDKWIYWGICSLPQTSLMGTICLWNFSKDDRRADLGYELHPDLEGKGIMSEAVRAVIRFGFRSLGLKRIEAYTHFENEASIRLLERHRFVLDAVKKDKENKNNVIYVLENRQ